MIANLLLALAPFSSLQGEVIEEPPVSVTMEVRRPGENGPLPAGSPVFAGEMLQVDIDLAVERNFLRDNLIPTWRLPLDVPMELRTPWLDGALGSEWREEPAKGMVSIVLDREVNRVQEILGTSDQNQHYGLRRWVLVPDTDGEFTLSPASVHFTWASEFADDMVRGLVPVDRQQSVLSSEAWSGSVQALPPAPEDFSGVIGNMSWTVQTSEPKGAHWVWHMEVHGSAWPSAIMLPEFPETDGLSLQGVRREELVDGYRAIMEFQIEDGFSSVRDWTWTTFSPDGPGQYQQWRMPDIEIGRATVEATLIKKSASMAKQGSTDAASRQVSAKENKEGAANWIAWVVLMMTVTAVAVVGWRWRQQPVAENPTRQHANDQGSKTSAAWARQSDPQATPRAQSPPAADLLDDLAAQLGCHRADLYDSDLAERLSQQTWPKDLTQDLLAAVEAHAALHFRGQGAGIAAEREAELRRLLALRSS